MDEQPAPKEDLDFCFEVDGCIAAKQLLSIRSQVIIIISAKSQRLQHTVVGRRVVDIGRRWPPVPQRPAQETSEAEKETSPKSIMNQTQKKKKTGRRAEWDTRLTFGWATGVVVDDLTED